MPTLPEEDKDRLQKMYPKIKDNDKALLDKYIDEIVNKAVMRNFNMIKQDVKTLVENEFERTRPFAEAKAAEREGE